MVYENIQVQQPNFCIAPLIGTYGNINTLNPSSILQFKNDSGNTTGSYTLNPTFSQDTNIESLIYLGPRNTSILLDDMPFVTLTRDSSSSCTIKKWNLNTINSRLDLDDTIIKTSSGSDSFDCYSISIPAYRVTLTAPADIYDGELSVTSTAGMSVGDTMYLGPSTNVSNTDAFEEVFITDVVNDNLVTISGTTTSGLYPKNTYNTGNDAVCVGSMYLFSDAGDALDAQDVNKGTMFVLDYTTGEILDKKYNAIYRNIRASAYGVPYHNTIGIVKYTELLYISIEDFEIKKSNRINNTLPSKYTYIDIDSIDITTTSIYRLQNKTTKRNDNGSLSSISWDEYNFQEDSVANFTDSIALYTDPSGVIANDETITIYATVRDQYGVGLSGKTVHFDKVSGDTNGTWGDVNKEGITDINGIASITYTSGWYDYNVVEEVNEDIIISAKTDGSSLFTGSIYIWAEIILKLNSKYIIDPDAYYGVPIVTQKIDSLSSSFLGRQVGELSSILSLNVKSKFQWPGGDWVNDGPPSSTLKLIKQLESFESKGELTEVPNNFNGDCGGIQLGDVENEGRLSQTVVSRHLPSGSNEDDVAIAQFRFIYDASPLPFSEKNNTSTTIWIRLLPYGFDLNQSTLVFKIKEESYVGDTGFIDYANTQYLTVTEFDAGGGLIGLDILYEPVSYFHNNAKVSVFIEVYDNATPVNKIKFNYWFTIIPDYTMPYIINKYPAINATNVPVNSVISFDIIDNEVGVNIDTLEFYVNNRIKDFTYTTIEGGYSLTYDSDTDFYYEQRVEISIRATDTSENENVLYDMWKFDCEKSAGPWIDSEIIFPKLCVRGVPTRQTIVDFNIYDIGTGLNKDSIKLLVDNKEQETIKIPIIYRVK